MVTIFPTLCYCPLGKKPPSLQHENRALHFCCVAMMKYISFSFYWVLLREMRFVRYEQTSFCVCIYECGALQGLEHATLYE